MLKLFSQSIARPDSARAAARAEEQGWNGLSFVDSQNLSGDVYVAMATAAMATDTLEISTGVTNPVTRHPAVTAGAVASVQSLSKGRAQLGIGRGDSSLAHLGRAPARVADFERYLVALQVYLNGGEVPFNELGFGEAVAPPVEDLELAATAGGSTIAWLPTKQPKVPLEVAATGPRVIGVAARHADRIMFALGADPVRIEWGMSVAREARVKAGLDPEGIAFGTYVNIGCLADLADARDLVRGGLSTFVRFAVMHGDVIGPVSSDQADVMHALHDRYDMRSHTRTDSNQAQGLPPDFVDKYAIVGPPDTCIARLQSLAAMGLDKVVVVGASMGTDRKLIEASDALMIAEVLGSV